MHLMMVNRPTVGELYGLFFLSGFAALIYQVCWQKLLLPVVGIDTYSVAIVVVAFMTGLGIGGALGGTLADTGIRHLLVFGIAEVGIAIYGAFSVVVLSWVSGFFSQGPGVTFLLLVASLGIPTVLMGATLPLLVIGSTDAGLSVGDATGALYFVNTLGAAVGALASGVFFLHHLDLQQLVWLAAGVNTIVAVGGISSSLKGIKA